MNTKLSLYQKEIQETENAILCVAKAEKMVSELGKALIEETETTQGNGATETHHARNGKWSLERDGILTRDND